MEINRRGFLKGALAAAASVYLESPTVSHISRIVERHPFFESEYERRKRECFRRHMLELERAFLFGA